MSTHVVECDFPPGSALSQDVIENAYFHDSYRSRLTRPELGIVDVYAAIFGHTPLTMKLLLIVRNAIVGIFGLKGPTAAEVMHTVIKRPSAVGDNIGRWRVFFIGEDEIIAGDNDKHLDFRVSVLRVRGGRAADVVVTTICDVHNFFGKFYLFFIVPYHRHAVRTLMSNAVAANRL
jgi:hypothetical protein